MEGGRGKYPCVGRGEEKYSRGRVEGSILVGRGRGKYPSREGEREVSLCREGAGRGVVGPA